MTAADWHATFGEHPAPGPGVWQPDAAGLPRAADAMGRTPAPLRAATATDQFLPPPPPAAFDSRTWVRDSARSSRSERSTSTPVRRPRRHRTVLDDERDPTVQPSSRDVAVARGLGLLDTPGSWRANVVGADAQIACHDAKYHYRFWRPVTAIDPRRPRHRRFGTTPAQRRQPRDRRADRLAAALTTPNHPEYPAAHGSLTSARPRCSRRSWARQIDLTRALRDVADDATRYFNTADDLRDEIVNARLWGGLHYRCQARRASARPARGPVRPQARVPAEQEALGKTAGTKMRPPGGRIFERLVKGQGTAQPSPWVVGRRPTRMFRSLRTAWPTRKGSVEASAPAKATAT